MHFRAWRGILLLDRIIFQVLKINFLASFKKPISSLQFQKSTPIYNAWTVYWLTLNGLVSMSTVFWIWMSQTIDTYVFVSTCIQLRTKFNSITSLSLSFSLSLSECYWIINISSHTYCIINNNQNKLSILSIVTWNMHNSNPIWTTTHPFSSKVSIFCTVYK